MVGLVNKVFPHMHGFVVVVALGVQHVEPANVVVVAVVVSPDGRASLNRDSKSRTHF